MNIPNEQFLNVQIPTCSLSKEANRSARVRAWLSFQTYRTKKRISRKSENTDILNYTDIGLNIGLFIGLHIMNYIDIGLCIGLHIMNYIDIGPG